MHVKYFSLKVTLFIRFRVSFISKLLFLRALWVKYTSVILIQKEISVLSITFRSFLGNMANDEILLYHSKSLGNVKEKCNTITILILE